MKRKLILLIFVLGFVGAQAQKNIDSVNFEQPLHNFLKVGLFSSDMVLEGSVSSFLISYEVQKSNFSYELGLTKRFLRKDDFYPSLSGIGILTSMNYENLPNSKYFTLSANIGFQLTNEIIYSLILMPDGSFMTANQHSLVFGPMFGLGVSKKLYRNFFIETEIGFSATWWIDMFPLTNFNVNDGIDPGRYFRLNLIYDLRKMK